MIATAYYEIGNLTNTRNMNVFVYLLQVADLRYASPATVSRCGMVYVDPKNLGYMPYWTKWCEARPNKNEQIELSRLFDKYVPPSIDLILEGVMDGKQGKKLKNIIPLTNLNMVRFWSYLADDMIRYSLACYSVNGVWYGVV